MGNDESHFNVSVGSHKTVCANHNLFEEKGEPKRYRTEVLPLTRTRLTARPNRLTLSFLITMWGFMSSDEPFFPVPFSLFDWVGILWPQLSKVLKRVRWACSVLFPRVSLQRQVVYLLLRPVFISGESLHCFLAGVNKTYSNL